VRTRSPTSNPLSRDHLVMAARDALDADEIAGPKVFDARC
jgi:hypothetical protein